MEEEQKEQDFSIKDVILILHQGGDTTFIINDENALTTEQKELVIRFYMCIKPSLFLRLFLLIEGFLTTIWASLASTKNDEPPE